MYKLVLVTVFAIIATTSSFTTEEVTPDIQKILKENRSLVFIGTIEGKTYFAEAASVSWTAANAACIISGLTLATIQSPAQHNLLVSKNATLGVNTYYWTGGNAAQAASQYRWGSSTTDAVTSFGTFSPDSVRTALAFRATSTTGYLYGRQTTNGHAYLCQTM